MKNTLAMLLAIPATALVLALCIGFIYALMRWPEVFLFFTCVGVVFYVFVHVVILVRSWL